MGRAIQHERDIEELKRDVRQLKTAFKGLSSKVESIEKVSPTKKNVDLHEKPKAKAKAKSKPKELATEEA